jgi:hypothetical protein
MKKDLESFTKAPARIFVKLAILGCFLLGFVYISILLLNTAMRAIL